MNRTARNIAVALTCTVLLGLVMFRLFGTPPAPKEYLPDDLVKHIFSDAAIYEWNWMNWMVTDWVLTLLAAGTAITAAVKNAFSSHNQAQAQAAAIAAGTEPAVSTSGAIDKWVMVFAALTIIATTLDSRMHASLQAERYRMGDLILQDAIMDYRNNKDEEALLNSWHQAQKVLEGVPQTLDGNRRSRMPTNKISTCINPSAMQRYVSFQMESSNESGATRLPPPASLLHSSCSLRWSPQREVPCQPKSSVSLS